MQNFVKTYDRETFLNFLYSQKKQRPKTAKNYAHFVARFTKSDQTAEEFVNSYANASTHDNAVNALKHYYDFIELPRPATFKYNKTSPDKLITAPKKDEVLRVLRQVKPLDVKAYLALCATVGLRPQRLLTMHWQELDFENDFVNINENVRSKRYRPNPIHADVAKLILRLKTAKTKPTDRVFTFGEKKFREALVSIDTPLRPHDMRDFFYNHARRSGVDKDLVEWCMGHSIGIRAHYLGDDIKQEYAKFEQAFRLEIV